MRSGLAILSAGVLAATFAGLWKFYPRQVSAAGTPTTATHAQLRASADTAEDPAPSSRLEVQRLLRARDFARLTRIVESKQAKVERDVRREMELARVIGAFETADPTLTPLIDAWVAAEPKSYAPLLARAEYRFELAFAARGEKLTKDTSEQQFQGMEVFLKGTIEDAQAALKRDAGLGEAYRMLINAARTIGNQDACTAVADRGIAKLPGSLRIRVALAICMLPRWGGDYALLEAVAKASDAHVKENPALSALHGFVEWDRGRLSSGDEALEHYAHALEAGEHWFFYRDRARAHLKQQQFTEALADAAHAMAVVPDEPEVLMMHARALRGLGRFAEAVPDLQLVAEIDATDDDLAVVKKSELETAAVQGYQLLQGAKDPNGAIARLAVAIDATGGNAEVYYWRGRAYLLTEDHEHALSDFEAAIRLDPHHFESYLNIDFILAKRGDWDAVIRHWTRYIELEPTNGRAYLERGGAYNHKGSRAAALDDARKGCDLGAQGACAITGRVASR